MAFFQNLDALAFGLLGVAMVVIWAKRRTVSQIWLPLAIVLLSTVVVLGRIPTVFRVNVPLLSEVDIIMFVGSAYALFRYRASIIPLRTRWHTIAVVALVVPTAVFLATMLLGSAGPVGKPIASAATIALIVVWSVAVGEPIVRFLLVARGLSAVQAWRLRSLSLAFGGIVLVLLFAVSSRSTATVPALQIAMQLFILLVAPLLYVSVAPPTWLRRQWRAAEEEGLSGYRQDLVVFSEDASALAHRGLDWAMRLSGADAAVAFNSDDTVLAVRGLERQQISAIQAGIADTHQNLNRMVLRGVDTNLLVLAIGSGMDPGRLALVAGPYTPNFGHDEVSLVQQFMSGVMAAVERAKLVEKLKQANHALIDANQHKSVFLASMSHELRTPMNAIIGFSELMIDAKDGELATPTLRHYHELILTSGKHLLGLINDILDLSKIEAGQMELRLEAVSIAGVVGQVVSTIEPLAAQRHVRIEATDCDAGSIEADAGKLKQMLLNLTSNAIKFTPSSGLVSITATRLADAVELKVTDTGIGIAESDQARIFHEFQQVDTAIGRKEQGTGLGLSLTKRFAALHGGDVRVQSEPGKGSVFTLRLPLVAIRPEKAVLPVSAVESHHNGNSVLPLVLVVEDDPSSAELLVRQLEAGGFRTELVTAGSEVVGKARTLKPAAITLDILLADVDGWEVLSRLKNDAVTSAIPVIVISVVDNPEFGIAMGAHDCLVKPVVAGELIDRLSKFDYSKSVNDQIKILVVDDELANRELLVGILEPAGFNVILASGGLEAIAMANARKPDAVVLDLMMPDVTGFDVIEQFRAKPATEGIPVIVLTAKDLTEEERRYLNGKAAKILTRSSTDPAYLVTLLRQTLANRAANHWVKIAGKVPA